MTTISSRNSLCTALRLAAGVCLVLAFVVHGFSSLVTELLGPVHFHSDEVASLQVMAGWQDPRRNHHVMDGAVRPHGHDLFSRHRHDVFEAGMTVVGDDGHDITSSESAAGSVSLHAVAACACMSTMLFPAADGAPGWALPPMDRMDSCDPDRLERPPRA